MNKKNIEDCIWKGREKEYNREYMKNKRIYNAFTRRVEKYTGPRCPDGLVRHHIFYDLDDINNGIVFITQSEHMKIHQEIRNSDGQKSIPIYCEMDGKLYEYNQKLTDFEHKKEELN